MKFLDRLRTKHSSPKTEKSPPGNLPQEPLKKNVAFVAPEIGLGVVGVPLQAVTSTESRHGGTLAACYPRQTSLTAQSVSFQNNHRESPATPFPSTNSKQSPNLRTASALSHASTTNRYQQNTPAQSIADSDQINAPVTWAQMTNHDLVGNLGARERTRQEVLWEIVASEERYVAELISMVQCYVDPLLHPHKSRTSPESTPSQSASPLMHSPILHTPITHSPESSDTSEPIIPLTQGVGSFRTASADHLPIAARFARSATLDDDGERHGLGLTSVTEINTPRTVSGASKSDGRHLYLAEGLSRPGSITPDHRLQLPRTPTTSHESPATLNTATFKHHLKSRGAPSTKKLHRPKTAIPEAELAVPALPQELRVVLECISETLLNRHELLGGALKERWRAQYPLVRSLADVWMAQDWIISAYSVYVLNLEKGLRSIDTALSSVNPNKGKRSNSNLSADAAREEKKLARWIMRLEEDASAKGESGLAICLSKPFQRLLKYPLLFQNLLFHTDASTAEYDSTRNLAIEIDRIVKSIENDKISEEERDKIRDLWARIEGVNDQSLMLPSADRFLLEEEPLWRPPHNRRSVSDAAKGGRVAEDPGMLSDTGSNRKLKPKSNRRLSDMMSAMDRDKKQPSLASKRDIWLVRLSDVIIRCQRIGLTRLPLGAAQMTRETKSADKKNSNGPERNLYRFIQVERWDQRPLISPLPTPPTTTKRLPQEHRVHYDAPSTDNEVKHGGVSRMSFSYAADEPRLVEPLISVSNLPPRVFRTPDSPISKTDPGMSAMSELTASAATKRGPAPAKFANRLRTSDIGAGPRARSPTPTQSASYMNPTRASASRVRSTTPINNIPRTFERSPSPIDANWKHQQI